MCVNLCVYVVFAAFIGENKDIYIYRNSDNGPECICWLPFKLMFRIV